MGFSLILGENHVPGTGNMSKQSNRSTSLEKPKTASASSRETAEVILRNLPVFSTVPPIKTRLVGPKTQFLEPKHNFPKY